MAVSDPASVVRPEFGPTLPELIAGRTGRSARGVRIVMLVVIGAVALAIFGGRAVLRDRGVAYVQHRPIVFNLRYPASLHKVAPIGDEYLRLELKSGGQVVRSFAVAPLTLPPYTGAVSGVLPVFASGYAQRLAKQFPDFTLTSEGRARVNGNPGYTLYFRTRRGSTPLYARYVLLPLPGDKARRGVVLQMFALKGTHAGTPEQVGAKGPLVQPFRTFRFGTKDSGQAHGL